MPCTTASSCPSFYHSSCIEKWLAKDASCPLCRRSFPHLSSAVESDSDVPLAFGLYAPLFDPPPVSNPLRMESQERFISFRELAQRYHSGPSWRQQAGQATQASSSLSRREDRTQRDRASPHLAFRMAHERSGWSRRELEPPSHMISSHDGPTPSDFQSTLSPLSSANSVAAHDQQLSQVARLAHAQGSSANADSPPWDPDKALERWHRVEGLLEAPCGNPSSSSDAFVGLHLVNTSEQQAAGPRGVVGHSLRDGSSARPDTSGWRRPKQRGVIETGGYGREHSSSDRPSPSADVWRRPRPHGERPSSSSETNA